MSGVQVVNQSKFNSYSRKLLWSVSLGSFTDNYNLAINGAASLSIIPAFHITAVLFGFSAAIQGIGAAIGAFAFGFLADRFGRRRIFVIDLIFFAISTIVLSFTQTFAEFVIMKGLVGAAIGGDFVPGLTMLSEMVQKNKRGRSMGITVGVALMMGTITVYLLSYLLFPVGITVLWRYLYFLGAVPAVLALIVRIGLPEPPRWIAEKNDQEARKTLDEMGLSQESITLFKKDASYSTKHKFSLLKPYILGFTIPMGLITLFLGSIGVGIGGTGPLALASLHLTPRTALLYTTAIFNIPALIGTILSALTLDRVGRRRALWIGSPIVSAALFAFAIYATSANFLLLGTLGAIGFLATWYMTPILFGFASEVYPAAIRGVGQGINQTVFRLTAVLGGLGGTYILTLYKASGLFEMYGLFALLGFIIALLLPKKSEPMNLELEEVTTKWVTQEKVAVGKDE